MFFSFLVLTSVLICYFLPSTNFGFSLFLVPWDVKLGKSYCSLKNCFAFDTSENVMEINLVGGSSVPSIPLDGSLEKGKSHSSYIQ